MIGVVLAAALLVPSKQFRLEIIPDSLQIRLVRTERHPSPPLAVLPCYDGGAYSEISIGGKRLGLVVPQESTTEIIGFDGFGRPYYSVGSSASGAYTVTGSIPLVPSVGGLKPVGRFHDHPWVDVRDIGPNGELAIVLRESFPRDFSSFRPEQVPIAGVLRGDDWAEFGRATELKLGFGKSLGGITQVASPTGETEERGFFRSGARYLEVGPCDQVISTGGEGFFFLENETTRLSVVGNSLPISATKRAAFVSDSIRQEMTLPGQCRIVAGWSPTHFIAVVKGGNVMLFDHGNEELLTGQVLLPKGLKIEEVRQAYKDGSLWIILRDQKEKRIDAKLVPAH